MAVALSVVALAVFQYLGYGFQYFPGDLIDSRLVMYLLEHGYKWITGHPPRSFQDAPFFYPARGVLAYSDNFVGQLPFYVPWRLIGFDRETAFQIWVAIGFALNFFSVAWVLKKLKFHWSAVLVGAYVFTLSQAAIAQIGHGQLLYRFAIPPAWYFLHQFLERFSWKDLLACAGFVVWQACCSLYLAYFLIVFLALYIGIAALRTPLVQRYGRETTGRSAISHAAVALAFVAALIVVLRPYFKAAGDQELAAVRLEEALTMLPRPVSYLMSWPGNWETGWLYERSGVPMPHEHILFVGLIPWACVLFLLFTRKRPGRSHAITSSILAMLGIIALTLYIGGVSLYLPLLHLPGIAGIRSVTRWILVLLLPFSLATAQTVHLCRERLRKFPNRVAIGLLCATAIALAFENHISPYRFPKAQAQARLHSLAAALPASLPPNAILAYLQPSKGFERQPFDLDAMLVAQDKDIVTVNGYTSHEPKGYRLLRECADLHRILDDVPRLDNAFRVENVASRIVVVGSAVDTPCTHLDAHATVQTEPLPDRAFRAKIQVMTPASARPQEWQIAKVLLTNTSDVLWRARGTVKDRNALRVACRWYDPETRQTLSDYDNRFDLPYDLPPGDTAVIPAALKAPAIPGAYQMECDAVQELVHWFRDLKSPVGTAPVVVIDTGPPLEGFLDRADKDVIAGWAWEKARPNGAVSVEIYDGPSLLATVPANAPREDLKAAHKGNGIHSFAYPPPPSAKAAGTHTIHIRIAGTQVEVSGSPKTYSVAP